MNVGIVGFGFMGSKHGRALRLRREIKAISIYDIDPSAEDKARSEGFYVAEQFGSLIEDESIKLIVVATPNDSHYRYCNSALQMGKNVLVEKPATLSKDCYRQLCATAKQQGCILMTHLNRRHDSDFLLARDIVQSGRLGRIAKVESSVFGGTASGLYGWRSDKDKGGGLLWDWGSHLLDQSIMLFGSNVKLAYAEVGYKSDRLVEDFFQVKLLHSKGPIVSISSGTFSAVPKFRWVIEGAEATLLIPYLEKKNAQIVEHSTIEALHEVGTSRLMEKGGWPRYAGMEVVAHDEKLVFDEYDVLFTTIDNHLKGDVRFKDTERVLALIEKAQNLAVRYRVS